MIDAAWWREAIRRGDAGRDERGAAQSYVALGQLALAMGKLDEAATYATRALEAHTKFGDQRGLTQARAILRAARPEP